MSKTIENQFEPNYAIAPGEILEEELESRSMSQAELAERTGLAKKTINEIIKAKAPITPESALKFERVFRLPADYWLNLEKLYQESLARIQDRNSLEKDSSWLQKVPVNQMIKFGWIRRCKNKPEQLNEVLSFLGIASVDQWKVVWSRFKVAYRTSPAFKANAEAISAWLRQGEIKAQSIDCAPFNTAKFRNALKDVRGLTRETKPRVFVPRLVRLCADAGVAVVFVPELPKTHVSGATRWLNKNKAIIQLSLRYKSDDHLWFTFFHEAGHIIIHGKKELFIEGNGLNDGKEQEANDFASNFLITVNVFNKFVEKCSLNSGSIKRFAKKQGISPGIVVGQLQHHELLDYSQCNHLKTRFKWSHE